MNKCSRIEEMIRNNSIETDMVSDTYNEELSGHINTCADCMSLLADLRSVSDKIRSVPKISVSSGFNDRLWSKIRQAESVSAEKETEKVIPFFSRAFYYVSGVAAIVIAFIYVSSLGVFDTNNLNNPSPTGTPGGVSVASDYETGAERPVTDSLENLGKNVTDDDELRLKISTGE